MDALNILKSNRIKATSQRIAIINCIIENSNHLTAEDILKKISSNKSIPISMPTVYNNLNLFVKKGIISELVLSTDNKKHYDYIRKLHYHVICKKCNRITDVTYSSFESDLSHILKGAINKGFLVKNETISLYGICESCQRHLNNNI